MICNYGCGQEAKYQTNNGKWCCSENWQSCPESKLKNSKSKKGKTSDKIKQAAIVGGIAASKYHKNIRQEYENNPKLCLNCQQPIPYEKIQNKFCSRQCSGSCNTKGRIRPEKEKKKISMGMKKAIKEGRAPGLSKYYTKIGSYNKSWKITINKCIMCGKLIVSRYGKKTCSKECYSSICTGRTYQNGSRKTIWYDNPNQGKVCLESSWEVIIAELLDSLEIKWIRPNFIRWVDSTNKKRIYWPDFYIPKFDVYLDPKNPYCCERDLEKMEKVSKTIHLIWGDLSLIEMYINEHLI